MRKTSKFTISMPAAEFKEVESLRRKSGRTRSQFIRDAVASWKQRSVRTPLVREDQSEYGTPQTPDLADITGLTERRRRAIAAAGRFRSGAADLSSNHDRYLGEAFAEVSLGKNKARARKSR
jgi:hypothetical protein